MPSGDYLIQTDATIIQWLRTQYYPEVNFIDWGSWQPRPQAADPSPSVVLEGVDLGLTHREVVRELKDNATVLEIPEAQLKAATLTFARFYRKGFSGPEPTPNGRLIGPLPIISAILHRQGLFLGTTPVYARTYARPQSTMPSSYRGNEVPAGDARSAGRDKRTTDTRLREEQDVMQTEERDEFEPLHPSAVRQRTTDNEPRAAEDRSTDSSRKDWLQGLSLPSPQIMSEQTAPPREDPPVADSGQPPRGSAADPIRARAAEAQEQTLAPTVTPQPSQSGTLAPQKPSQPETVAPVEPSQPETAVPQEPNQPEAEAEGSGTQQDPAPLPTELSEDAIRQVLQAEGSMPYQALLDRFRHLQLTTEDIDWMNGVLQNIACWTRNPEGAAKRVTLLTEVRRSARLREKREREHQEQQHQPK